MNSHQKNSLVIMLAFVLLAACKGKPGSVTADSLSKKNDSAKLKKATVSNYSKKTVDSLVRVGAISPDSLPDVPPSQSEEREALKLAYDRVETIDTVLICQKDTLHFHSKRYCLKDVKLVEPKLYDPDEQHPKEFVTHPFVADIWLAHNKDTVLKRQFKAADFNPAYRDNFGGNLKKYGSIIDLYLEHQNRDKKRVVVSFSIAIPATDLGINMYLIIDKKGGYKMASAVIN
ncbi:hypothetical protein [Mucilaginibacter dorajii]|uniref:Lipoprotein n=1 Tax=Mucilaginibacter dorajii TaxID=692994 RepID=A0ABP7Q7A9_9SPHI|nr:hypothetical protein [Mucilaginibacter dorajii]MCS3737555.1 hypothetical protein [Mucilaginibacter dorajii]